MRKPLINAFTAPVNRWFLKSFMAAVVLVNAALADWLPLVDDGLHDPTGSGVEMLQEPAEALSVLSPDTAGNYVNWMDALRTGEITPRSNIWPDTTVEVLDSDVILRETGDMPMVLFPHDSHTAWLDCSNCHDGMFEEVAGATKFGMKEILEGRYCGRCHGAVSFPLTECSRCHNVSRN